MPTVRDTSIPLMSPVSDDLVVDIPRSRIAVASMVGTTVEFYDFYLYATAAVSVFPQLFFSRSNPTTALPRRWRRSVWRSWPGLSGRFCSGTSVIESGARRNLGGLI